MSQANFFSHAQPQSGFHVIMLSMQPCMHVQWYHRQILVYLSVSASAQESTMLSRKQRLCCMRPWYCLW